MKRKSKKNKKHASSTIISRGIAEKERGGALLLVSDEDVVQENLENVDAELVIDKSQDISDEFSTEDIETRDRSVSAVADEKEDNEQLSGDTSSTDKVEDDDEKKESAMHSTEKKLLLRKQGVVHVEEGAPAAPSHPLDELFDDEDDMDFSRLEKRRSRKGFFFGIFVFICFLGAAAFLGYSIFKDQYGQTSQDVELSLTVPEKVASGDVVEVDITFLNTKSVGIDSAAIEVVYPDGFVPNSTEPEADDEHKRSFTFENILSGAAASVHIVGQLVGSTGQEKNFSVIVTYRPNNVSQDFQVQDVATTHISSSQLNLSVDAPKQVASAQDVTMHFTYSNESSLPLERVRVEALYPNGFTVTAVDPSASHESSVWNIDLLAPDEERTITITGSFAGNSGDTQELVMNIGIEEIDGTIHPQTTQSVLVIIVNPEFSLDIQAPDIVDSADSIEVKTTVKNTADADMQDIHITWEAIGPVSNGATWTDDFKKIQGLQSKDATHTVKLGAGKKPEESVRIVATILDARLNGNTIVLHTTAEKIIKIRSVPTFSYEGRYFDEELKKIGSGPIPPIVGEKTTYAIEFSVSSELAPVTDLSCSTLLPEDVSWLPGDADAEFDDTTRMVNWEYDALKPETTHTIEFFVSITPDSADVDHLKVLTEQLTCNGKNSFTQESISTTLARITTDLVSDEGAAGKGVVEAQ